ncbi:mucin-4-like [Scylla paramamosain]|uniref:mucin-4-like n=1 Tax=Scylla paramamosain TaxID=85552 RepID=UPI003083660E
MVAGGVQSVEEGALYATHTSYYPQFYSTLLPPAPPGSYSSSNYSSSTYSSSGQSSDYSWLKLEGAPGGCHPSTPGRTRHPKCTCPSPEALRQARRALAARRVRTARDPRCTCPSPTLSRDPSPWGGASPSPPSTPATASPPPRHPRCTCPEPDLTLRLSAARRARSARDLRCTCPPTATPTPTPTPPPPTQEPTCTCQPPLSTQPQQPLTRRASKNRLVHAVLLNSPGNTAISTEHGDFVPLSDAPTKISESPNPSKARAKARKPKEKNKIKGSKSEEEVKSGGEDSSQPASPARRVKDKLCHLRHKVVSGVVALTAPRPPSREGEAHGCRCDISNEGVLRVRAPGSVTRVLPPPNPTPTEATPQEEERCLKAEYEGPCEGDQSFPVEDLPQPILEGVCSPLGEVPPLSPPEQMVTPFLQHSSSSLSCSVYKTLPNSYLTMEGHRNAGFPVRGLRDLQRLSASHGHLYSPESTALSRTKSLELYEKDSQEGETESSAPSSRGSVIHLPPASSAQCWTKKVLPQSSECNPQGADDTLYISSPCISSSTNVSPALGSRICAVKSVGDVQDGGAGPDYENVVFHDSGRYVMLSKRLLDKWQLSYEACLPPDHALMQHQEALHGEGGIPTVKVTENIQVSTALPCDERESDNVALTQTPPSATSVSTVSTTSTTAKHRTSQPTLLSTSTHTSYILTSPSPASSYSSPNQSLLDMTLKFPDVPPRLSIHPPAPPSSAVTSLSSFFSSATTLATTAPLQADPGPSSPLLSPASTLHHLATQHVGGLVDKTHYSLPRDTKLSVPKRDTPRRKSKEEYSSATNLLPVAPAHVRRHSDVASTYFSRTGKLALPLRNRSTPAAGEIFRRAASTCTAPPATPACHSPPPRHTTPHHTTPHHTTPYHITPHHTTPRPLASTTQFYFSPPPHHATPHPTTPYPTTSHLTISHPITPHHTTPHHTTPHNSATRLHLTTPHHTTRLHYTTPPHYTTQLCFSPSPHHTTPYHTTPHHTTPHLDHSPPPHNSTNRLHHTTPRPAASTTPHHLTTPHHTTQFYFSPPPHHATSHHTTQPLYSSPPHPIIPSPPHHIPPHHTTPYHTTPYHTTPHCTTQHPTPTTTTSRSLVCTTPQCATPHLDYSHPSHHPTPHHTTPHTNTHASHREVDTVEDQQQLRIPSSCSLSFLPPPLILSSYSSRQASVRVSTLDTIVASDPLTFSTHLHRACGVEVISPRAALTG